MSVTIRYDTLFNMGFTLSLISQFTGNPRPCACAYVALLTNENGGDIVVVLSGLLPLREGGYFHIWATRVCAAQQGMLFASLTLEQGIKITLSLWKRVYFTLGLTLEQGRFFPES